jgi:hypothetical protein
MLVIASASVLVFGSGCATIIDSAFDSWDYNRCVDYYKDRGYSSKDARGNAMYDQMWERR